jgi:hypothetical protein
MQWHVIGENVGKNCTLCFIPRHYISFAVLNNKGYLESRNTKLVNYMCYNEFKCKVSEQQRRLLKCPPFAHSPLSHEVKDILRTFTRHSSEPRSILLKRSARAILVCVPQTPRCAKWKRRRFPISVHAILLATTTATQISCRARYQSE